MKSKLSLVLVFLLFACYLPPSQAPTQQSVYVEPALLSPEEDMLSVIVTGADSAVAARAVERIGGHVTSELWLIDAVGAVVPAAQIDALAAQSGVRSIVANKQVRAA